MAENPNKYNNLVSQVYSGKIRILFFLMMLSIFLLNGCIETIDFDVKRTGGRLVVDGTITDSPGPHQLKLRRTAGREKITDPLTGAGIRIEDNLGNSEYYFEKEEGVYELTGHTVKGVPGRSYTLEITIDDGQKIYRSEPEVLPGSLASDSIFYEFDTVQRLNQYGNSIDVNVIRVLRDTRIPQSSKPLYLKWEIEEVFKFTEYDFPDPFNFPPPSCYITDYPNPQTIYLYDGSELSGGTLETEVMTERVLDDTFYQLHYMNVIQYSISQKAHKYWKQVDQIVNQSGTIFDVPPANPHTNITNINDPSETVLGYFQAARVDSSRFFVVRFDLPVNVFNPCSRLNGPDCNGGCRTIKNSRSDPPFYWLK